MQSEPPVALSSDEAEEHAYLERRDLVSDEELVARMNAALPCGGSLLVELSDFVTRRNTRGAGS